MDCYKSKISMFGIRVPTVRREKGCSAMLRVCVPSGTSYYCMKNNDLDLVPARSKESGVRLKEQSGSISEENLPICP